MDGTDSFVKVLGSAPSHPTSFVVCPRWTGGQKPQGNKYDYANARRSRGPLIYEADNTALDLTCRPGGRRARLCCGPRRFASWRLFKDEIRRQEGTKYVQDEEA